MPVTERRALVAGGGIGGLTTGLALHRRGWQVVVFERAARLEPVGAGISLWPNALRALDTLGLAAQLRGLAAISGATGVRRPDGRWLARSDVGGAVHARFGEPLVVVHRAELLDLLVGALPSECVRTGVTVLGVDLDGEQPVLRTDGGDHRADLVVAADGIRSMLREQVFPGATRPRYAGYTAWRMVVPAPDPATTAFETWGRRGQRFAVLPLGADRWYCYATASTPAGGGGGDETRELVERFGHWHDPIPGILRAASADQVLRQDVEELDAALPAMHRGRLAVVGDAAHAMTPDLGQGGCMAVEDGVELAFLLDQGPVEQALQRYTERRLPRTTAVQQRSRRAGRLYQGPYAVQLAAARLMGVIPDRLVARGLGSLLSWTPPAP